ncbi:MAG: radical SAM family RiPP maturation amino acid epimerase [Synergistaceae bacterium]|jgi:radical SAM family RiPP maturation amino acid epimerase|nr:radical SAM family RiPP maturation amino acid epimerase [Synergistaceae bacterium]
MIQEKPKSAYMEVFTPFSDEDISNIVMLKRVFECAQGDKDFAKAFAAGKFSDEQIARQKQIGVTFDLQELALCWTDDEFQSELLLCMENDDYSPPETLQTKLKEYPLLGLWLRFLSRKNRLYRATRRNIFRVPKCPPFDAWRWRRVLAARSELGYFGHYIDFPILAFELGDGCSVGCWFCAFSTQKLKTNLDYERYGAFFRDIAEGCVSLFGKHAAAMALLYYGTEPHDNPNYLDFIKDFKKVTGYATCTSTAMPLDADWLRSLIRFYREESQPWPRLSVLSKDMMNKIHDLYAPDELRDVELLMQMRENERRKVSGGRILSEHQGMKEREPGAYLDDIVPQGSIACVSGFLINTVRRDIQIVSPCYTCERWPYGYRVYDKAEFKDASDFPDVVRALIDRNMPAHPPRDAAARFRDDLLYKPTDDGFDLISPNQIHHFTGGAVHTALGNLIAQGDLTYDQLDDKLSEGGNPLLAGMAVNHLFDGGFMDELYSESR